MSIIHNSTYRVDLTKNGLLGKFFNGSYGATIYNGNIGTIPLTSTNDSSNVTGTTGMPSASYAHGVNLWTNISFGDASVGVGYNYGFIAIGYFTPPTTGTYIFYTSTDDYSGVWVGDVALEGYTRSYTNATCDNGLSLSFAGGLGQSDTKRSGSINLTSGAIYPIRIVMQETSGWDKLFFTWSGSTVPETNNLSTYFYPPITTGLTAGDFSSYPCESIHYNPRIVNTGLQFLVDAGSQKSYVGTGTTWKDLSGNGNHTTLINAPTYTNPYFTFNGTNQFANVASSIFNRTNGTELTLVCWINPTNSSGNYQYIIANRADGGNWNWMLFQHPDFTLSFHGLTQFKTTYIPTPNVWQQVTVTVDASGNCLMYINGVLTVTTTGYTYGIATTSSYLGIGAEPYSSEFFNGKISQVGVYSRVLSVDQIRQNYNAMKGRFGL